MNKNNIEKNVLYNNMLHDILKQYDFGNDWEYIVYYIENDRKIPYGIGQSIKEKEVLLKKYINLLPESYIICRKYNIHKYNVGIFDIDEKNLNLDDLYEKYDFLKNTLITKGNNKGFHVWSFNENFIDTCKMIKQLNYFEGDLITDSIWEKEDKTCLNNNKIQYIEDNNIIKMYNKLPTKTQSKSKHKIIEKNQKIITAQYDGDYEDLEEIVDNIPKRFSDNYQDWLKIISILRKYDFYDLAKSFSKKSKKYNELEFQDYYKNKTTFTEYNIGSIYHYSKENRTNFLKIKKKYDKIKNKIKYEDEYEKMEIQFNKNHFKVSNKCIYCKIDHANNDLIFMKKQSFVDANSELKYKGVNNKTGELCDLSFINRYVSHNSINPRIYTNMDFFANKDECPDDYFNLWTDFDVCNFKNVEIDDIGLDFILNHILILCNYQQEVYEYFIDFLAHMFQRPWEKSVFIMFLSKEGTGKDLFISLLKLMIGESKYFETPNAERDVFGNFNPLMLKSFLVNLSELEFLNTKGSLGKFKQFITGDNITINGKGKDPLIVKSYHRYIGTSNELCKPIITKEGDRRTLLIASSNEKKGNTEYFSQLAQYVKSKNVAYTFYKFLMELPDADIFINKPIPKTEYQETIKEHYEDNLITWLKDFTINVLDTDIINKRLSNKELYTRYKEYLQEIFGADYKCTIKQFALKMNVFINQDIKNTDIIKITKPSNKITYNINFELLLKFFGLTHNSIEIINQDSSNQDSDSDSDSIEIDT